MQTDRIEHMKLMLAQSANILGDLLDEISRGDHEDEEIKNRRVDDLHRVIKRLLLVRGHLKYELERRDGARRT